MVALEGEWLAAPEAFEDGQGLGEHGRARAAVALVATEPGAFVRRRAEAHGKGEAATREPVEGGGLPRYQPGTAPCEGRQHRAKADALGADGDRGEQHPGVGKGRRGLAGGDGVGRVPEEHPIPARLLGVDGELNQGGGVAAVADVRRGSHRSASRECTPPFSHPLLVDRLHRGRLRWEGTFSPHLPMALWRAYNSMCPHSGRILLGSSPAGPIRMAATVLQLPTGRPGTLLNFGRFPVGAFAMTPYGPLAALAPIERLSLGNL